MPVGTIPKHLFTNQVPLSPGEIERANDFAKALKDKLVDHRKTRGWARTRYNPNADVGTLLDMCATGIMGEFGIRKYMEMPVPRDIHIDVDYFDGGVDLQVGRLMVQVKAAMNPHKYHAGKPPWLLSPRTVPIRFDKVDAVALTLPRPKAGIVEMIGFLTVRDFLKRKEPFPFDRPGEAEGVPGEKLMQMSCLYLAERFGQA